VNNTFISKFPTGYTPNSQQSNLIPQIEAAFKKGKKFVICNASTGSGKSLIAKTLANNAKKATPDFINLIKTYEAFEQNHLGEYINDMQCLAEGSHGAIAITVTKALQDQYLDLFTDTCLVKGKSNYACVVDENYDVETAPCVFAAYIREECQKENKCPYYNARNDGLIAQFTVTNYKMFSALPSHVKRRDFIICDEASELEEELVKQFSAEVVYAKLKYADVRFKPLITDDLLEARSWIADVRDSVDTRAKAIQTSIRERKGVPTVAEKNRITLLKNLHTSLTQVDESWTDSEYIVDRTAEGVNFTPLRVDKLSKSIFDHGEKILLLSATIVDHKNFAKVLGITDYEYIEAPCTFDPKKSPIYVSTRYRLNYKNLKGLLPQICADIKKICDQHATEKGVIHTHSQEICDYLNTYFSNDDRFLFRKGKEKNEHILKQHSETTEATVLVSPSLTHGVDLKDDLARFQIIVKLPYAPLYNKRVSRLFENDKVWYQNKMLSTLVQTTGRATRSADDHSVTYILDGNTVDVLQKSLDKLPAHFISRFA